MDLNKIFVAIVEDDKEDLNNCLALLNKYSEENNVLFEISTFESGDSFLIRYKSQYDFIILDINLSATNGIEVARKIRETDEDVIIMFATNLAKYVTKGYEVAAIDYALKPLNYSSFYLKMERIMKKIRNRKEDFIAVPTSEGILKVNVLNILYIEVVAHDVFFHLVDKTISTHGSFKEYENKLGHLWFIRCNSCYLVNAHNIKCVEKYDITLSNGETIVISHPKKKSFMTRFKEYIIAEGK